MAYVVSPSIVEVLAVLATDATSCAELFIAKLSFYITDWYVFVLIQSRSRNDYLDERSIPLAYGALLLVLALFKAIRYWKLNGVHDSRLVLILIKDQAFYFTLYVVIHSEIKVTLSPLKGYILLGPQHIRRGDHNVVCNRRRDPGSRQSHAHVHPWQPDVL